MVFKAPGDIIFTIFGFPVYYYGVIMAAACLIGVLASYTIFKRINPNLNYEKIWDFAAYILIFGFLSARIYYCLLNPVYYLLNPFEILNFREGGLSIHGGLIGGALSLIFLAKRYGIPVLKILDAFSCGTILAQSIGRWGNFFNSEAFGAPTNLPWKLFIPLSKRPEQFINSDYFHPTFLYESLFDLCIFIILIKVINKFGKKYSGLTTFIYLLLYSLVRIFVESLRVDSALNIQGVPIAQIISFFLCIVGIIGIVTIIKQNPKNI